MKKSIKLRSNNKNILFLELLNYQTKRKIKQNKFSENLYHITEHYGIFSNILSNKNIQRHMKDEFFYTKFNLLRRRWS